MMTITLSLYSWIKTVTCSCMLDQFLLSVTGTSINLLTKVREKKRLN